MTAAAPPVLPSIPGAPVAFHLLAKPTGAVPARAQLRVGLEVHQLAPYPIVV